MSSSFIRRSKRVELASSSARWAAIFPSTGPLPCSSFAGAKQRVRTEAQAMASLLTPSPSAYDQRTFWPSRHCFTASPFHPQRNQKLAPGYVIRRMPNTSLTPSTLRAEDQHPVFLKCVPNVPELPNLTPMHAPEVFPPDQRRLANCSGLLTLLI